MTQPVKADLHLHSSVSDGSLSPAEVVARAASRGMRVIALTDHDAVEGIADAVEAGNEHGVLVLPGIELTLRGAGRMHLLGYGIDPDHPQLCMTLRDLRYARQERMNRMLARLTALGCTVCREDVDRLAQGVMIGRAHLARAMVACGDVAAMAEAFDRYIGEGKPGYEPSRQLSPDEGIMLIRRAGGNAVLAHPWLCGISQDALEDWVARMKRYGMTGLECYGPSVPEGQTPVYRALARRYDLVITGGSDFHGAAKPTVEIGDGLTHWNSYMALKLLLINRI